MNTGGNKEELAAKEGGTEDPIFPLTSLNNSEDVFHSFVYCSK